MTRSLWGGLQEFHMQRSVATGRYNAIHSKQTPSVSMRSALNIQHNMWQQGYIVYVETLNSKNKGCEKILRPIAHCAITHWVFISLQPLHTFCRLCLPFTGFRRQRLPRFMLKNMTNIATLRSKELFLTTVTENNHSETDTRQTEQSIQRAQLTR